MDWAARNHVPAVLGEFGAFPAVSPPGSRAHWFDAMRKVLGELKAPHCVWGYDDVFGLGRARLPNGRVQLDPVTMHHLYGLGSQGK